METAWQSQHQSCQKNSRSLKEEESLDQRLQSHLSSPTALHLSINQPLYHQTTWGAAGRHGWALYLTVSGLALLSKAELSNAIVSRVFLARADQLWVARAVLDIAVWPCLPKTRSCNTVLYCAVLYCTVLLEHFLLLLNTCMNEEIDKDRKSVV